jgi:hypothetical protein
VSLFSFCVTDSDRFPLKSEEDLALKAELELLVEVLKVGGLAVVRTSGLETLSC